MSEITLQRHEVATIRLEDWDRQRAPRLTAPRGAALVGGLVLLATLGVLTGLVVARGPGDQHPALVYGLVGLLDLTFLGAVAVGARTLRQGQRYRDAELLLDRFPFLVGEPVTVRFRPPQALRDADWGPLIATFRCARQQWVAKLNGNSALRTHVVFEQTTRLPAASGCDEAALAFEVPPGSPPTQLESWPHHHYELELSADAPGLAFHAIFLLPVYQA